MIDFACKTFQLKDVIKCALGLTKADLKLIERLIEDDEKWFTSEELAKKLKLNITTIQRSVKHLHTIGVIKRHQNNLNGGGYIYLYQAKDKREIREIIFSKVKLWTEMVKKELDKW